MSAEPQPSNNGAPRRFRLAGKNFIVTWPQCNESKERVLERVLAFFGETLVFAVVSHEQHQNGDPHLHAVFALNRRKDYTSPNCFDNLANSHGNYQVAKSLRASVKYVAKDGDFISHGVDVSTYLEAAKKKESTKSTLMAKKLLDGATLQDLNEQDPGFVMMNQKKLKEYQALIAVWMDTPTKIWKPIQIHPLSLPASLVKLAGWLNVNLGQPRQLRQKQLLLSSPPGMGKTTLVEALRTYFRVYDSMGDKWFDGFDPLHHQIIVYDEFHSNVPLSIINKILDGQRCLLQTKGGSVHKVINIPVIILTNYTSDELYVGEKVSPSVREAFLSRCLYIRLKKGEECWRLLSHFDPPHEHDHLPVEEEPVRFDSDSELSDFENAERYDSFRIQNGLLDYEEWMNFE